MPLQDYNNGTLTVTASGGTAPFTFLLKQNGAQFNYGGSNFTNPVTQNGNTITFGDSSDLQGTAGIPSGTYTCQITDANGCTVETGDLVVAQQQETTTSTTTTSTTSTTTTSTTTTSTTTTTTTTIAPEPLYWFHLGSGVGANDYPFQQNLITGSPQYLSDNTTSTSTPEFEAVFADALANPGSYQTINSRTTIADGDQFAFNTSNAANFYWLLIPDSMGVPDLTQNARLASISNNINDVAAQVLAMNVNGQPYKLYRINIAAATAAVTIQYNV